MTRPPRPPHPAAVADPGLQGERTYLAWQRTGLAFAAVGALLLHVGLAAHHPLAAVPGLLGLVAAGTVFLRAMSRYRTAVAAARGERPAAVGGLVALTAVAAGVLGAGGVVVVLTGL